LFFFFSVDLGLSKFLFYFLQIPIPVVRRYQWVISAEE